MVIAVFKGSDIARVYDLWQWDYGQKLRIQGLDLPTAVEIHFSLTEWSGESITRVGNTVDGVTDVIIPDSMLENETALQSTYNIYAFIYLTDDTSGETVKKIVMEVKTRPKPEAFDAPEDAELFQEAIQAVNDAADRAKVSETNASDSAASAQSDAAKTTAERLEVERLVQSVSGIEDEVKVVEQYKEQAIQAAQTAGTSEQNAKASETAAQVAQKAAESAKALTEQNKTAAAESANTSVQAAENAEESARSAEQSASQTAQIAQVAVQNIEQAGSEQVNAVNVAGESQKQVVNAVGTSQVEAVTNAGAAQVEEVNSAGEEKVEAIQQKGHQVLDSIPQDYNTAMAGKLDKQQGTENAGKVMTVGEDGNVVPADAPQGMTTEQKQQLDKATADIKDLYNTKANVIMDTETGNPVVMKTVEEGLDIGIEMQGWTRQNQYEGNQLFDIGQFEQSGEILHINANFGSKEISGINYKENTQYVLSFSGYEIITPSPSGDTWTVAFDIYYTDETHEQAYTKQLTEKMFISKSNKTIQRININNVWKVEQSFSKFMINEGSTAIPYESYTGGQPSPSPEYQQEIVNSGKYNSETQKYEVEVKISKNNIFPFCKDFSQWGKNPKDYYFGENEYSDYSVKTLAIMAYANLRSPVFNLKPNTKYTISGYIHIDKTDNISKSYGIRVFKNLNVSDGLKQLAVARRSEPISSDWQKISATFTTDNMTDTTECYVQLDCSWNDTEFPVVCNFKNIMISYGDNTEWEPYEKPQTVKVTSDRPITKWDRLIEMEGQIGWEYGGKEIVFDGSDDENWKIYRSLEETYGFLILLENLKYSISEKYLCNMFSVVISGISSIDKNCIMFGTSSDNNMYLRIKKEIIEDGEIKTFKEWLKSNLTIIQYAAKTPEFVPLPSEEQEALRDLKTYYPTSIISNDQDCQMDVTYAMDTKTYIDKKFEELQSALVTTNSILLGGE